MSEYNLTFNEIIENFDLFKLGIIIENENGQRYKLTKTDNDYKKFSRIDKGLRFMTYDNINKKFKITEEQQDLDIQSIHELDLESLDGLDGFKLTAIEEEAYGKINELVKAVKQLDKKTRNLPST